MRVINLLPKPRQQEIRYERVFHSVKVFIILSMFTYVLVIGLQYATKIYLQSEASSIDKRIAVLKGQIDKNENAEVKKQVKAVNDSVEDFRSLANGAPTWSKLMVALSKLPPDGVKLNSVSIDGNKKLLTVNGYSPTREKVIQFYNNVLADDVEFYNIDYPLENVVKPTEVLFHFTFNVRDDLMK